jgi:hypothetical protein
MNRLCDVSKVVKESAIGSMNRRAPQMPKAIHVLSVGAAVCGSVVHDALLNGPRFSLYIATDYRELWAIPKHETIQVVILHNTLSSFELDDASRFIRQRWPHARILVVRNGEGFLDDALYDVRVVSNVDREVLRATFERLIGDWHEWRSRDAEL